MVNRVEGLGEIYRQGGRTGGRFVLVETNCDCCRQGKQSGGSGVHGSETVLCVVGGKVSSQVWQD